jgi:phage baseplate assembly protein W
MTFLGRDMLLTNGDLTLHPAGDVATVEGLACLAQDLALRLTTPVGSCFLDPTYGTRVFRYLNGSNTPLHQQALLQDLRLDAEQDPRVEPGSAVADLLEMSSQRIRVRVTVQPSSTPAKVSLVLGYMADGQVEVS